MVHPRLHPLLFFASFTFVAVLTAPIFSLPVRLPELNALDHQMLTRAKHMQANPHYSTDLSHIKPVPNFEASALDHARTHGAKLVGSRVPPSRMMGGKKHTYFYTLVDPLDSLGKRIGLKEDQVMTVLWRHDGASKQIHMMHVGGVEKNELLQWELDPFQNVMRHFK